MHTHDWKFIFASFDLGASDEIHQCSECNSVRHTLHIVDNGKKTDAPGFPKYFLKGVAVQDEERAQQQATPRLNKLFSSSR